MLRHVWFALTLSVTSASMTSRFATDAGSILSDLTNYLGVDEMHAQANSPLLDLKTEKQDGEIFLKKIEEQITEKIKTRMNQLQKNRKTVEKIYAHLETGASHTEAKGHHCCDLEKEKKLEYDANFMGKILRDQICIKSPQGHRTFKHLLRSLDGKVINSKDFQERLNKNLVESNQEIKWQYYGANANGLVGIFPGDKTEKCDEYDPRFRPWYVAAASAPKNVIIMIESGTMQGKDRTNAAKSAAAIVLNTLSSDDTFNVVIFGSQPRTKSSLTEFDECISEQLVSATPQNLETMRQWVKGDAGTSGKPDFGRAFHKAFDILDDSFAASPGLKERPTTILFLTHTDAPSPVQEIVNRTNITFANNREQLLIFPFGFGNGITEQAKATLKSIALLTNTTYKTVQDGDEVRTSMASYYEDKRMLRPVARENPLGDIVLTAPYRDAFGLGLITTLAAPVRVKGVLKGVVGVDLTLTDLMDGVAQYTSTTADSYAFVADAQGRVLLHPNLPEPRHWKSDPVFLHVDELEAHGDSTHTILSSFLAGNPGKQRTSTWQRSKARGGRNDGTHTRSISGTFYWRATETGLSGSSANKGGELRIGYFLADSDKSQQSVDLEPIIEEGQLRLNYHRLDFLPLEPMCCIGGPCDGGGVPVALNQSAVYLAPRLFREPISYTGPPMRKSTAIKINELLNDGNKGELLKASSIITPEAVYEARLSRHAHEFWRRRRPAPPVDIKRRYLGTKGGVFSISPAQIVPKGYDCQHRSWYIRAQQDVQAMRAIAVSRTEAALQWGRDLLTLSKAIVVKKPGGRKQQKAALEALMVMGMDVSRSGLKRVLNQKRRAPLLRGDGVHMYLLDAAGFVLLDLDPLAGKDAGGAFVGAANPAIARTLRKRKHLVPQQCANYQSARVETHFTIATPTTDSSVVTAQCRDGGSVELAKVDHSQVFVLVNKNCRDDDEDYVCATHQCPGRNASTHHQVCPCESALGYFICGEGRFQSQSGGQSLVACGQSPASSFIRDTSTEVEKLRKSLSECQLDVASDPPEVDDSNAPAPHVPYALVAVVVTAVVLVIAIAVAAAPACAKYKAKHILEKKQSMKLEKQKRMSVIEPISPRDHIEETDAQKAIARSASFAGECCVAVTVPVVWDGQKTLRFSYRGIAVQAKVPEGLEKGRDFVVNLERHHHQQLTQRESVASEVDEAEDIANYRRLRRQQISYHLQVYRLTEQDLHWEREGIAARTFLNSNFKIWYDCISLPGDAIELFESVRTIVSDVARASKAPNWQPYYKRLLKQAMAATNTFKGVGSARQLSAAAEYLWTSQERLMTKDGGPEFCTILNEAIRLDEPTTCMDIAKFVRCLNAVLVQRANPEEILKRKFPKDAKLWRGAGFDDEHRGFFAPGKRYRVPAFLATSFSQSVSRQFLRRSRKGQARAMWCIQVDERGKDDPLYRVQNVALINASHVKGEEEYLFPPYSVFEVVSCQWTAPSEPHEIVVQASLDNALEEDALPLAPWY